MAKSRRPSGSRRGYQRSDRVNQLLQRVLAEELRRIDREELGLVTITGVEADPEVRSARVFLDHLDDDMAAVLAELRPRLQRAINDQARLRNTPELSFHPDPAIAAGQRIDELLRRTDEGDDE